MDAAFDPFSENFDPKRALLEPERVKLPFPDAIPLDNLSKCYRLMPSLSPDGPPAAPLRRPKQEKTKVMYVPPVSAQAQEKVYFKLKNLMGKRWPGTLTCN